jgi:hydrogenase/urease accessory protein HupE
MLSRDHAVFAAAMAVEAVHLVDDGLVSPHDGVGDLPSTLISVGILVAAVALYGRLPVWARAVLAGLFGLAGLASGLEMHVIPSLQDGATGSDYTGFGHAAAGAVLLALSAALATRRKPNPQPS